MRNILFKLVFLFSLCSAVTFNILTVTTWPSKSHFWTFSKLFRSLAERGHNITVISHFPDPNPLPNYRDVEIGGLEVLMEKMESFSMFKNIRTDRFASYLTQHVVASAANSVCQLTLQSKNIQRFLKEENVFDIILIEDFYSDCSWAFAGKFKSSVILLLPHVPAPWTGRRHGNPLGSAYLPNVHLPLNFFRMTFFERLESSILNVLNNLYFNFIVTEIQKKIVHKYLTVEETTFDNRVFNASLVLMNTHYVLNIPKPLVPNMIEVGGIHMGETRKLSKDIENWINGSKHGVIYFSLGSVIKGHTMPEDKRRAFINAFKRLPQRVIWKWEIDTMEGKTDNIMIGKWMPQFDIISHPNVKAFISHGGLLGTMEAVHCGVPMMVMPQFGDQHTNAKALESVGGGVILYMNDANEETIYQSLKKILEPSFQTQAKELSERFRDRPMPPLETAIYWVEYVARHKGAHFMKTAAVNMPFYQYYLLDVIAFILVFLATFSYLIYIFLKFSVKFIRNLCKKSTKQKTS